MFHVKHAILKNRVIEMDIVARILNFSLMIAMPFVLAVYLVRQLKAEWKLFGIGCVTFIISQVFHIPFNQWVLNPLVEKLGLSISQSGMQLAVVGIFYGLSAGLFEEVTRYFGYRISIKDERNWKSALMYGAGHGGVESILVGIISFATLLQLVSLRGTDLSTVVEAEYLELARSQVAAYWSAPWHMILLGALERMIAITFHVSASVLILQSFRKNSLVWLGYAIAWHAFLDAVAVFAAQTWNPYVTEAILFGIGLLSLVIILRLRTPDEMMALDLPSVPLTTPEIQPVSPSEENLEDSRYV